MSLSLVDPDEEALASFLARMPSQAALPARSLAHAWTGGGGRVAVGNVSIRLLGRDFTAGTIAANPPRLELCRVLLEKHGVAPEAWRHWSDAWADLAHLGFDANDRFPRTRLDGIDAAAVARMATGLRDLARLVA